MFALRLLLRTSSRWAQPIVVERHGVVVRGPHGGRPAHGRVTRIGVGVAPCMTVICGKTARHGESRRTLGIRLSSPRVEDFYAISVLPILKINDNTVTYLFGPAASACLSCQTISPSGTRPDVFRTSMRDGSNHIVLSDDGSVHDIAPSQFSCDICAEHYLHWNQEDVWVCDAHRAVIHAARVLWRAARLLPHVHA